MSMDPMGGNGNGPLPGSYNSMQRQAGLLPQLANPPPVIFPGQVTAMLMQGGSAGAMALLQGQASMTAPGVPPVAIAAPTIPQPSLGAGMFPGQMMQTMLGSPPLYQGPTGMMAQMMPSAPYSPYPGPNPYAGMGAYGPFRGAPSPFTPMAPAPPPYFAGPSGVGAVPFAPPPATNPFNTPFGQMFDQQDAAHNRAFAMQMSAAGVGARLGTNAMAGLAGAALGARFGGVGAAIGGIGGFLGSEFSGLGQAGQNGFMNFVAAPFAQQRALAGGIEHMSREFISGGPFMNASGQGFSHEAAMAAARGITSLGNSSDFRRETFDRFNSQDLAKLTQSASTTGMMGGVSDPTEMVGRVRDIARSVNAFMELAKEPDLQRAIQTMGSLRSSGLNLSETLTAVQSGRVFARMAGRSFSEMAEHGGAIGSSAFQSMGLTQGLGFGVGMANLGISSASINRGVLSPQLSALVGGASGLASQNNMFSAGLLQMPMMAPGLMSMHGGLNAGALQSVLGGGADLFGLTNRGSSVLGGMTGRYGIEGLGMAIGMQPLLQDTIGRALQAQGPFAGRNFEDRTIMGMSRQLGMRGSAGFMTAAQTLGMSQSQALARAQEMASPAYFETQRDQLRVMGREARTNRARDEESQNSIMGTLRRTTFLGRIGEGFDDLTDSIGDSIHHAMGGDVSFHYNPSTDVGRRDQDRRMRSREFQNYMRGLGGRSSRQFTGSDRYSIDRTIAEAGGARGLVSMFAGAFGDRTDSGRRSAIRDLVGGGEAASALLATDRVSAADVARSAERTFGQGDNARASREAFSNELGRMISGSTAGGGTLALNGLLRTGVSAGANALLAPSGLGTLGGMAFNLAGGVAFDPGNMLGSSALSGNRIREAFVNAQMQHSGMTREQAMQRYNPNDAMRSLGPGFLSSLTRDERATLRHSVGIGDALSGDVEGRTGTSEQLNQTISTGFGRLGATRRDDQTALMASYDRISGVGRNDTQRTRMRAAGQTLAALAAVAANSSLTDDQRNNIRQQRAALLRQVQSEVGEREAARLDRQAADETTRVGQPGHERELTTMRREVEALRGRPHAGLDDAVRGFDEVSRGSAGRSLVGGVVSLSAQSTGLRDIIGDVSRENYDQSAIEDRLRSATPEQIRALRNSRSAMDRNLAGSIERFARGDQRGLSEFNSRARLMDQASSAEQDFDREHGGIFRRVMDGNFTSSSYERERRQYVQGQLRPGSAEEESISREMANSADLEASARERGQGTGEDALVQAASDLREAARMFRDGAQSQFLDNGLPGPGGG
jgi:hypothetical protein